jgi:threonyl-tRNA synthetase
MERFIAVLIEHTGGNFPLWLAFEQVAILPISDKYIEYAQQIAQQLENQGIRVTIDDRSEKTGKKIRDAEMQKTPYMIIVGEKEMENNTVAVRKHGMQDMGSMQLDAFAQIINNEIKNQLS